jgi:hypothetical protein
MILPYLAYTDHQAGARRRQDGMNFIKFFTDPLSRALFLMGLFMALFFMGSPASAISFDEARHLLARTGFGVAAPARIRALQSLSYEAAVDQLLGQVSAQPITQPSKESVSIEAQKKWPRS